MMAGFDKQTDHILKTYHVDSSMKLQLEDLPLVRAAMIGVKSSWYDVGVELEVDTETLDDIKAQHHNEGDACLTDTIAAWLTNGKHPNLRSIVIAISSRSAGGNPQEAEKVAKQFNSPELDASRYITSIPEASGVDDTPLERNEANQKAVVQALEPIRHMWKEIGIFLGLDYNTLQGIVRSRENTQLQEVVKKWLKRKYDTEKFGPPSWKRLVEAVGSKAGGNDASCALKIAQYHKAAAASPKVISASSMSNPAEIDNTRITANHHADLLEALYLHAADWMIIGTFLGFQEGELKNIMGRPMLLTGGPPGYLSAMLDTWYQWAPGDGRGSKDFARLGALKEALNKANLGATATELHTKLKKL